MRDHSALFLLVLLPCISAYVPVSPAPIPITTTSSSTTTTNNEFNLNITTTTANTYNNVLERFRVYPKSAIDYPGSTYYTNYKVFKTTSVFYAAEMCWADLTCLSFDYDGKTAYMHRINQSCVDAIPDASFLNGTHPASTFYELPPSQRNSSCPMLVKRMGTESIDARVVVTVLMTTLCGAGVIITVIIFTYRKFRVRRWRRRWNAPIRDEEGAEADRNHNDDDDDVALGLLPAAAPADENAHQIVNDRPVDDQSHGHELELRVVGGRIANDEGEDVDDDEMQA